MKTKVFFAAAGLIALAVIFFFNPAVYSGIYPPCPFHRFTGLYCPGCGSLRAIHQLLRGDLISALRYNPLTVLLLGIFLAYGAASAVSRSKGKPFMSSTYIKPFWIWALLGVIILFWVIRNIPFYPFTGIAPHPL